LAWEVLHIRPGKQLLSAVNFTADNMNLMPLCLGVMVAYGAFRFQVEWQQCSALRRAAPAAVADFVVAHLIAVLAIAYVTVQYLAHANLGQYLVVPPIESTGAIAGVLAALVLHKWWRKRWVIAAVAIGVVAAIGGTILMLGALPYAWLAYIGIGAAAGAVSIEAWRRTTRSVLANATQPLSMMLDALVVQLNADSPNSGLRATVYVPDAAKGFLVQATDYMGRGRDQRSAGRRLPLNTGVAGRSYREGQAFIYQKQHADDEQSLRDLVQQFGLTREQAMQEDQTVSSVMAVPLFGTTKRGDARIEGILSVDSQLANFFTAERMNIVESAAVLMSQLVRR
jgi:hypothetical protein